MNKRRITISLLLTLLVEAINKLSPIFILYFAQSRLGTEQFGYSQFAITMMETAIPFIVFGYLLVGSKEVARLWDKPQELASMLGSMMTLRIGHAFVTTAGLVALCVLVPDYKPYLSLVLMLSFVLFASAVEMNHVLIAKQKVHAINLALGLTKLVSLFAIFRLVQEPADANLYAILIMGTNAIVCLASIFVALKMVRIGPPKLVVMKDLFLKGSQFALVYIGLNLLDRYDVFLAEHFFGTVGAAHYMGPARISQSLHSIVAAAGVVFMSELMSTKTREAFTAHIKIAVLGMGLLVIPACVGVWFLDDWIITLIFGSDYSQVARLLSVLVLAAGIQTIVTIFGFQVLALKDETKKLSAYLFVGLAVGIALSYALAAKYSLYGIGAATVLAKLTAATLVAKKARSYVDALPWVGLGKCLAAATVMAGVLSYLDLTHPVAIIAVAGATYFGVLSVVARHDLVILIQKLRGKNP